MKDMDLRNPLAVALFFLVVVAVLSMEGRAREIASSSSTTTFSTPAKAGDDDSWGRWFFLSMNRDAESTARDVFETSRKVPGKQHRKKDGRFINKKDSPYPWYDVGPGGDVAVSGIN